MTYYHMSKRAALEAGKKFLADWHVKAEMEPYNGWVIVLTPRSLDVFFDADIKTLMEEVEVEGPRFRKRPEGHKSAPPPDAKPKRSRRVGPPPKPSAPPPPPPAMPKPAAPVAPAAPAAPKPPVMP